MGTDNNGIDLLMQPSGTKLTILLEGHPKLIEEGVWKFSDLIQCAWFLWRGQFLNHGHYLNTFGREPLVDVIYQI